MVPGKLVPTIKPGPGKGKKKARVVACGNFTNKDAQDDLYASTGDAVVLRILMKKASEEGWRGASLDVKTAFLNTPWDDMGVSVRPPNILIKMGLVEEDTLWLPTKALYGFRKSPRLWGNHRDEVLRKMRIGPAHRRCRLTQFQAEPNLWKIQDEKEEALEEGSSAMRGLIMVYVDDVFAVGEEEAIKDLIEGIQKEWQTSQPEWVSEEPVRFLGIEIKEVKSEDETGWVATQHNYTRDLLKRNLGSEEEAWKKRKIPMTKDSTPEVEEDPTKDQIREAQRVTGELIWLVTRTRPDLMFVVSRMASQVLRSPCWVREMANQVWGYLNSTLQEGIIYRGGPRMNPWEEMSGIQTYADASFSPGGEESHGAVVVMLRGAPLIWRSSKQGSVTLSTAEAELNELIEGLMMGESVAAIMEEMEPGILKMMISDSQAAVNICLAEGGSWRTRHLRLRASHARQRFVTDWVLQHKPGEEMVADIGTKALASTRLEALKEMIGMVGVSSKIVEEKKEGEVEEKRGMRRDPEEVESLLRMVVLMAAVKGVKGQGREERDFGWFWLLAAWAGLMMLIGMCVTLRWVIGRCRMMIGEKRGREPEEEPEREVEDQREDLRRRRPAFLGSPVPTPSPQTSGQIPEVLTHPAQQRSEVDLSGSGRTPERRPESHSGTSSSRRDDTPTQRTTAARSSGSNGQGWPQVPPFPQLTSASASMVENEDGDYVPLDDGTMTWWGGMSIQHPPDLHPDDIPAGKGEPHPVYFQRGAGRGRGKGENGKEKGKGKALSDSEPSSPHGTGSGSYVGGKGHGSSFKGSPGSSSTTTTGGPQQPPTSDGGNAPGWRVYITRWGARYHTSPRCQSLYRTRDVVGSRKCPMCGTEDLAPNRVSATGPGSVVHEDITCPALPRNRNSYPRCTLCG